MKRILKILTFPIYCLATFVVIMGVQCIDGFDLFWRTITVSDTQKITWKAIMNYGGGYRVEDANGKVIIQELSSTEAMHLAKMFAEATNITVQLTYWEETPDGLQQAEPFGPKNMP